MYVYKYTCKCLRVVQLAARTPVLRHVLLAAERRHVAQLTLYGCRFIALRVVADPIQLETQTPVKSQVLYGMVPAAV